MTIPEAILIVTLLAVLTIFIKRLIIKYWRRHWIFEEVDEVDGKKHISYFVHNSNKKFPTIEGAREYARSLR